jgi:hypothetical protein
LSFLALSPRWDRLYPLAVRRTAVLLTASFRFHLAMDTLAVRLAVPTIRACSGLAPPSLRNGHHSQFARAYALRAMPGAPLKATPGFGSRAYSAAGRHFGEAQPRNQAANTPARRSSAVRSGAVTPDGAISLLEFAAWRFLPAQVRVQQKLLWESESQKPQLHEISFRGILSSSRHP